MERKEVDHKKVSKNGHDYAVLPYSVFLDLIKASTASIEGANLSHMNLEDDGHVLVSEWRKCLNLTQEEVAGKMGIPVVALDLLEKSGAKLRRTTIAQLAESLDLAPVKVTE
ncbi:MAG TPA: helix-turn-helix transcriptional regulator [Candidatus Ozemobacteraceae bacterium]|nr:helix-turn-helix transcriptional regulator [Candidatus Ozemobacteraceae bacterium]